MCNKRKKNEGGLAISHQPRLEKPNNEDVKISDFEALTTWNVQLLCFKLPNELMHVRKTPARGHTSIWTLLATPARWKCFNPSDDAVHLCRLQWMILIPKGEKSGEAFPLRLSESHLSPTHSAWSRTESWLGGDRWRWEGGGGTQE